MTLYDSMTYYYLICKQYYVNLYTSVLIYFIGFKDLKIYSNNQISQITTVRFLLYLLITKIINILNRLSDKINIEAEKVHVTKITYGGDITMILEKSMNDSNNKITFNNLNKQLNVVVPDNTMMKHILLNFDIVNDKNILNLKDYIMKYKDTTEQYTNTLQNILLFNNIHHNDNSIICIKLIKDRKMISSGIPLKDIHTKHINTILVNI